MALTQEELLRQQQEKLFRYKTQNDYYKRPREKVGCFEIDL